MGVGESWAYVWPDGSVTGEGERALGSELADAYRRLSDAGLPSLSAFSLEVDPDRDSYKVECALIGRRWNHPID